jgi:hypothetical protein
VLLLSGFVLFGVLGCELRASCILGRCYTTLATPLVTVLLFTLPCSCFNRYV